MKKIFETSVGNWGEPAFVYHGQRVMSLSQLPRILEKECSPYLNNNCEGVVVYMTQKEFESLQSRGSIGSVENRV